MPRGSEQLCDVVMRLIDCSAVDRARQALSIGALQPSSTAAIRSTLAGGDPRAEAMFREPQLVWTSSFGALDGEAFAAVVAAAADGVLLERSRSPKTEVVWTGPPVDGSFVRATREVVREIAMGAQRELVVVGYWLAARGDSEGIIDDLIATLSRAIERGVDVALALDSRDREDGASNKTVLKAVWPSGVPLPRLLTWRVPSSDPHLKLHAKVLVADARDALITSANLTRYAMDLNMEMGIRVVGDPDRKIRHHFRLLEDQGLLETF